MRGAIDDLGMVPHHFDGAQSAPRFQSGPGGSTVALMYEYDHPSVGVLRVRRRLITY